MSFLSAMMQLFIAHAACKCLCATDAVYPFYPYIQHKRMKYGDTLMGGCCFGTNGKLEMPLFGSKAFLLADRIWVKILQNHFMINYASIINVFETVCYIILCN